MFAARLSLAQLLVLPFVVWAAAHRQTSSQLNCVNLFALAAEDFVTALVGTSPLPLDCASSGSLLSVGDEVLQETSFTYECRATTVFGSIGDLNRASKDPNSFNSGSKREEPGCCCFGED
jgi:hypothetical protein